jgi:hypothetical protein
LDELDADLVAGFTFLGQLDLDERRVAAVDGADRVLVLRMLGEPARREAAGRQLLVARSLLSARTKFFDIKMNGTTVHIGVFTGLRYRRSSTRNQFPGETAHMA